MGVALLGPGLAGTAVGRHQVEPGIQLRGEPAGEQGLAHLRLHALGQRRRVDQPLPVAPDAEVGQVAARGFQPHALPFLHPQPVGPLLEIVQGAAHELGQDELGGRGQRPLGEGVHGEPGLALGPGVALGQHPVLAALEEHVEPAVLFARATRDLSGARHPVDDLQRRARGALRGEGIPAEPTHREEGALAPGRGKGRSVEDGIAFGRGKRCGESDEEQAGPQ